MNNFTRSFYSRTSMYAFIVTILLFLSMYVGTKQFHKVDIYLLGYMISTFICAIGITFRVCAWSIRPATRAMLKRSFQNMKQKKRVKRNFKATLITLFNNIILQKFIFKRGVYRGVQHMLIAWGCLGSFAITFALVLGWMHFDLVTPDTYAIVIFGVETIQMKANGLLAELFYNGLNITAMMLLLGLTMALIRRTRNKELRATQRFEFDLFPLYLLLAVTVSGLLLTVSYKFLAGFFHYEMALIHQITVVILLVYFPFGKLFHLPIRPLATAVPMNYDLSMNISQEETAQCKSCGEEYSSTAQIEDVKSILQQQAFDLQLADGSQLADYCVKCRRKMRVMKQLNLEEELHNPYGPIQTNTGVSIPGFSRKKENNV